MQIAHFVCLVFILRPVFTQFVSPCPQLFEYETRREKGQWNGTLTLLSKSELNGVWIRLIFDKPVLQVGNWFGELVRREDNDILIRKRDFKLLPNKPHKIKILVKYDENEAPPQLVAIRLNAATICPEQGDVTEESVTSGQLITSSILSTTSTPKIEENSKENGNCGTVSDAPAPLISHGQKTAPGQWPWHAALYYVKDGNLRYTCGATLVSKRHLLTAAHCVTKPRTNIPINIKSLLVYLGKYTLKKFGSEVQDREISEVSVHPGYNYSVLSNDIAILTLKDPIDITNYVRPCCLWDGDDSIDPLLNKLGTVVGWGFDEKHVISDLLMQAQMPIVEKTKCIYSNPNFFSVFTNDNNFCAGFRNGTSVCNGDSGGGMVFPKVGTTGRDTVWQIRGIVSLSVALQDQTLCDPEHFVIFTDAGKYIKWIKKVMNK